MNDLIRQESFWDGTPPLRRVETSAARATDDLTSHIAADKHTSSGRRQTNTQKVAELVRRMPGYTSRELSLHINLGDDTYHEIARRMPDAITAGAVRKGDRRLCNISGNPSTTWWPVG